MSVEYRLKLLIKMFKEIIIIKDYNFKNYLENNNLMCYNIFKRKRFKDKVGIL